MSEESRTQPMEVNTQVSRVAVREPVMALTIDGGPDSHMPHLLFLLTKADVKATLFVCGECLEQCPDGARQAVRDGHELGNHSYSHARLPELTPDKVREEIVRTQQLIEEKTGKAARLFRAPFLDCDAKVWAVLNELNLPAIHCSVDSQDYLDDISNEAVRDRMISGAQPGGIILMHGWSRKSQTVLVEVVEVLRAKGFRFVTVSQLLALGAMNP